MTSPSRSAVQNIEPAGVRRRAGLGFVLLAVGLGGDIWAALGRAPGWWRLAAVLPLWMAALCLIQAREKT